MKKLIIDNFKKTGSLFGIIGLIGGTVSDILQPLFPFVSYIFFFTSITSILLFLTLFLAKSLQTKIIPAFLCSFFIMFFSGIFYFFQGEQKQEKGFLAETIPLISSLQSSIGLLQDDISQIKKTTENIEETTEQIVTKLDEIQKEFSEINKSNGIIDNPTRPEQFYHNARIQELSGDYINARKSYNSYFAFKLDFIDPHLRYQTFLKIQEGRAGAREIYSYLYNNDPRPTVEYARILLFDAPLRTNMLKDFIESNPDFVPAYYELSREFSEDRKGLQTLSDKRSELKALQEFSALKDQVGLLKYFVDKELAAKWIEKSEILTLKLKQNSNLLMPVSATVSYYSKQHKRLFCCNPMYVDQEDSNATCTGRYKNDWEQISEGQICIRETKEEIYFTNFWEISVQIDEQSSDPVILLESEIQKIERLKELNNSTEFISTVRAGKDVKANDLEGSIISVGYTDSRGNKQGPYEIILIN